MGSVADNRVVIGDASPTQLRLRRLHSLQRRFYDLMRLRSNPATGEGVAEPTAETAEATSRILSFLALRRPVAETNNLMAQVYIYAQALLASPNTLRAPIYRSGEPLLASRHPIASVTGLGTNSFRIRMLEEGLTMQDFDLDTSVVARDVDEDPPAETSNPVANGSERSIINPTTTLEETGSVPANQVVEPNVSEEVPVKTDQKSVCGFVGGGMKPGSAFTLVALGAMGLLELKAQARFPFSTNPEISWVACTSLLLCGLAAIADHVISSTPLGPNSGYALAARWGVYVCAFVMAGSLASLLYI